MIPQFELDGFLAPGRYRTDVAEVQQRFVATAQSTPANLRSDLWTDLERCVSFTKQAVGNVAALWLGGGFVTVKPDPSDIDVVFIIDQLAVLKAKNDPQSDAWMALLANNGLSAHGFRLDTFVIPWRVMPEVNRAPRADAYFAERGHWDDFWQRRRSGPKGSPKVRADAMPLSGYLEVIVDGYS
jgi:hypothetical protein